VDRFTIANSRNWVALAAFAVVAVVTSTIAQVARRRALEAELRRGEADLAAAIARELLGGGQMSERLGLAARRLSGALGLPSAAILLDAVQGDGRRSAIALRDPGGRQIGTLLVARGLEPGLEGRLRARVAPTLAAILQVALDRDRVQAEAIETEALRRSDGVKTALLRAVSHDLRTPLTAIVAAGHALGSPSLGEEDRRELSAAVVQEARRLAMLVDKLLDLSRLQAGDAEPRREWISLEDVVFAARDSVEGAERVGVVLDDDLPEVRGDAVQLERALANLIENALRYCPDGRVSVHATHGASQAQLRVVDQGPGIAPGERERIFEPFYRSPAAGGTTGSGLGLAIARGLVEANRGQLTVSSLPGQGTTFTISLPLAHAELAATAPHAPSTQPPATIHQPAGSSVLTRR
jgi:two-component system sensor histidine kinase KdpD